MRSILRVCIAAVTAVLLSVLICKPVRGQEPAALTAQDQSTTDATPQAPTPQNAATAVDDNWRVAVSIYGWFPGMHGTVGVLGHNAGVHESFSDVFHFLKGVIPIAVEADKGRFVMPLDFFWVKVGDDRAIPLNDLGQTSINLHITQSIFTPKLGYRIVDRDHLKIDALAGIRYWYVGQHLTVEPSGIGASRSANWVDGLGGARFTLPLSEKAAITVAGDAGGGGANLDYQAVGLFTYKFTPKLGLGLGWRYLDVDYRGNDLFVYDVAQSGALAGVFFEFGGKPPVPPTASCAVSPTEIWSGDPVAATLSTEHFNPKHTLTYKWNSTGGKASGTGTTGNVDTAGLTPGSYTVTATATDEREKKNNVATCSAAFTVKQPLPPTVSCTATPTSVAVNVPATITMVASDPQGWPLTYSWSSTAGSISGSGSSATLDSTGVTPGSSMTVTGTAADSRGLSSTCNATVNVLAPPPPVTVNEVSVAGECGFKDPKRPWRVDNECKAVLDDVALRIQREPNGKLVVVGYAAEEEKIKYEQLGGQRAVNVKYYLTSGEGGQKIDPARIEPRVGTKSDKSAKFYFVPAGSTFTEESVLVDETQVKGQPRNALAPKKKGRQP